MRQLPGKSYRFRAEVEGTFSESAYPVSEELNLKEGAQVMFIRNDVESGRYFNGKIGKIASINRKEIIVTTDEGNQIEVEKITWEDRKSTRLNSSHVAISYAVFCLKKKKKKKSTSS